MGRRVVNLAAATLEIQGLAAYTLPMSDSTARPLPDDDTEAFIAAVKEGLVDAEAGRTLPYEDIRRWMLSWGTDREQSPPECP